MYNKKRLLIEFVTSILFKARLEKALPASSATAAAA